MLRCNDCSFSEDFLSGICLESFAVNCLVVEEPLDQHLRSEQLNLFHSILSLLQQSESSEKNSFVQLIRRVMDKDILLSIKPQQLVSNSVHLDFALLDSRKLFSEINSALSGKSGWIEIYGKPGTLKTQLCQLIISRFVTTTDSKALYLDCSNGGLFVRRILEFSSDDHHSSLILNNVFFKRSSNVYELESDLSMALLNIQSSTNTTSRWIVVVDSVAAAIHAASYHTDKTRWFHLLNSLGESLKNLSKQCLLVVVNHVTEQSSKDAYLGPKWKQLSDIQICTYKAPDGYYSEIKHWKIDGNLSLVTCNLEDYIFI